MTRHSIARAMFPTVVSLLVIGAVHHERGSAGADDKVATPSIIRASAFILVDDNGNERGRFEVNKLGWTELYLGTNNHSDCIKITNNAGNPSGQNIEILDSNGHSRIGLTLLGNGDVDLHMWDADTKSSFRVRGPGRGPIVPFVSDKKGVLSGFITQPEKRDTDHPDKKSQ